MSKTALILAAVVAASSSAAIAKPVEIAPSVRVSYADLDLTKKAGRDTLEARVSHAVSRLCPMSSVLNVDAMTRYRGCRKAAWSGARPQLATLYEGARYVRQAQATDAIQAQ